MLIEFGYTYVIKLDELKITEKNISTMSSKPRELW